MASITEKYGMSAPPMPQIQGLAKPSTPEASEETKTFFDSVGETTSKLNPLNLVDKAGNFILRAVVILVATGLISLGFFFMFKGELSDVTKTVAKAVA